MMYRYGLVCVLSLTACSEQLLSKVGVPNEGPGPIIEVTPKRLDFGLIPEGETSVLSFQITNIGKDTLEVKSIALEQGLFELPGDEANLWLAPSESREIEVSATQEQWAVRTDQVEIYSNDPLHEMEHVSVVGFGARPPTYDEDDCAGAETVSWDPAEIIVVSWTPSTGTGTVTVDTAGWYAIYDQSLAESGASQPNESAILQITNSGNPEGWPMFGNCGDWWIVTDSDNTATPSKPVYLGTFWLETGENPVTLHHYCTVYRSGQCQSFHNDSPSNGTCNSNNWNSVHLIGDGICLSSQGG